MTGWMRHLLGSVCLTVTAAAPEQVLNRLVREGVFFWDLQRPDPFTCRFSVRRRDRQRAEELAERSFGTVMEAQETGLPLLVPKLLRRKFLICALGVVAVMMTVLPGFVWCIHVEGNDKVPAEKILQELENLGVGFGTWGGDIVSQDLKNRMLNIIPELEWLTVNRSGGLATVIVRERLTADEPIDRREICNLVSAEDCLITQMEVLSGHALCETGDVVQKGQVLVSAYQELEISTQVTRALGEIYGNTWHDQDMVTPAEAVCKGEVTGEQRRYAVEIGKKRINFYGDSGIWGAGCDKIVVNHTLTLPGGYTLPISWIEEIAVERETETATVPPEDAAEILRTGATGALEQSMIAGQILEDRTMVRREGAVYRLTGDYACHEMVARPVPAIQWESEGTT